MNKYLEKIARSDQEQKDRRMTNGQRAMTLGSGVVASNVSMNALNLAQRPIFNEIQKTTPDIKQQHLRKMLRNNPNTNVTFRSKGIKPSGAKGSRFLRGFESAVNLEAETANAPLYSPTHKVGGMNKNRINLAGTKNTGIAAHEIGHAIDMGGKSKGRILAAVAARSGAPLAAGVGAFGMMATDSDKQKYAPAVAAAGYAPLLASEAKANYHAYKGLKRAGGSKPANQFLRRIVPKNMAGYAAYAAAATAPLAVMSATSSHFRNQNQAKAEALRQRRQKASSNQRAPNR